MDAFMELFGAPFLIVASILGPVLAIKWLFGGKKK